MRIDTFSIDFQRQASSRVRDTSVQVVSLNVGIEMVDPSDPPS
jgi:hypothetical protein